MSLLNKAYEAQCMKIQENEITDRINNMNFTQEGHVSNEDRLFMTPAPTRPQSAPAMTVVGGKFVPSSNNRGGFPLNGQQLQMQLDELTSAMTDMIVHEDTMEMPCNPAYNQYIHERCLQDQNPFRQDEKRRDPVYLSMAAHISPVTSEPEISNDNHESVLREQMEKRQFLIEFLQHHGINEEQYLHQQQLLEAEAERQYIQYKAKEAEEKQQLQDRHHIIAEIKAVVIPNTSCDIPTNGGPRLLKRPDLMPMQKCTMWT